MRISDWSSDVCSSDLLYVDDIEGVIDLVQMNTLEFHPWGARVGDPEQPDRMVFDLDPGEGVRWSGVVAAARATRGRLPRSGDRQNRVSGKSVSVPVDLGGRRTMKNTTKKSTKPKQ